MPAPDPSAALAPATVTQSDRPRAERTILLLLLLVLALALTLVFGPAPGASAVPPFDLPDELVDEQGALADPEQVRAGQDALAGETGRQLFVVVVDDLDGHEADDWLAETARLSGLGDQDLTLLVTTTAPGLPVQGTLRAAPGSGLSDSAADRVQQQIDEAAEAGYVDEVVITALTGLREAGIGEAGGPGGRWWWPALIILVVTAAALTVAWLLRRSARAKAAARAAVRAEELSGTLGSLVVALDQQLDEAQLELDLAAARVDDEDAARTLASAQESVTVARAEAVEVHRRRTALSTGPTDDLDWRVPPARAVAELEELHTLGRAAQQRLGDLQLP